MREVMLIVHFIGLAMGVGTSLAIMFLAIASKKMDAEEGLKFRLYSFSLTKMANIGIVLLIISGGYLMTPHWGTLSDNHMLMTKLVLVLVLAAFIGIIGGKAKKARKGDAQGQLSKIETLGKLTLITGITIVILAVYVFH